MRDDVLRQREQGRQIVAAYKALRATKRLREVLLAEYRCRQAGCLLATVFRLPAGVCCYTPPYKLSELLNERDSSAAGRVRNTRDGHRRWPEHGFRLEDLAAWEGAALVPASCDHRRVTLDPREVLAAVANSAAGRPTRPTLL